MVRVIPKVLGNEFCLCVKIWNILLVEIRHISVATMYMLGEFFVTDHSLYRHTNHSEI